MRTFDVAKKVIKQLLADKRSIGLMFLAPIFVILLLNVILTSSTSKPSIDIVSAPKPFIEAISKDAKVEKIASEQEAIDNIKSGKTDAYIIFINSTPKITVEGSSPSVTGLVMNIIKKSISSLTSSSLNLPANAAVTITPEIKYMYGSEKMSSFDALAPLLMGFFIFFFVFLIAGVSFLRERISGTLDRILATPLRRGEIVWGYFLGFGVFVAIQTVVIQTFIMYGLKVTMAGSFWLVLIINLILAGQSLALGTLLSSFAQNEFQLFQFIPLVIVPQILFSGIFDLSEAPQWVGMLSKIFPLTYGADALRGVMIKGFGFFEVQKDIYILIGYAAVFLFLNTLALKKYRKT
jgi:ABC-2 type transport system permease protein